MSIQDRSSLNLRASEEASEWLIEFRSNDVDAAARRQFACWLRAAPENVVAYLEMAALWDEGGLLDASRAIDIEALLRSAPEDDNVVPLPLAGLRPQPQPHRQDSASQAVEQRSLPESSLPQLGVHRSSHYRVPAPAARDLSAGARGLSARSRIVAIAVSVLLVCAAVLFAWKAGDTYSTGVGEQRSLVLSDGSAVSLNSRSSMRVRFSKEERRIELLEGQAFFRVAKQAARPFIVASDTARVRAVGTQFDVYRKASGTVVTVLEGKVIVAPVTGAESSAAPTVLVAGEQLRLLPQEVATPRHTNVQAATAWTQQRIVFESASIEEVAEELNRYNTRRIVVDAEGLDDLHISGTFPTTEPQMLASFLRGRPEIRVTETESEIRISRRQSK